MNFASLVTAFLLAPALAAPLQAAPAKGESKRQSSSFRSTQRSTLSKRSSSTQPSTVRRSEQGQIHVRQGNKVIDIRRDNGRIQMSITDTAANPPLTQRYTARNPQALRSQSPEAFRLYQKYTAQAQSPKKAAKRRPIKV